MNQKNLIILIVVILAVGIIACYFSYQTGFQAGKELGITAAKTEAGEAVTNPLEQMPETNPFEKVSNPFKDLYKNPFK